MSRRGEAIDRARVRMDARAANHLPDVCSFTSPNATEGRDADGYVTTEHEDVEGLSDVPCEYSPLSAYERGVGGSTIAGATHRLKLPANEDTLAISGTARGTIAARGESPALNFEVTGRLDSSTGLFLNLAITLR